MANKQKTLIYPLFLSHLGCPFKCVYCDQAKISGSTGFDLEQAQEEVSKFIARNPGKMKQIAFYGGSFTSMAETSRDGILEKISAVCDDMTSFRISTHPLFVGEDVLRWCFSRRIRTIELGIQDFSDEVLRSSGRGYTGDDARSAVHRVKDAGFETGVQLMPGLPGWSEASLGENRKALAALKPDLLRLYPLIVVKGTKLAETFANGDYHPLTLIDAISQCADYYPVAEANGIKIIKVGLPSNLPASEIVAGPWHPSFGEMVKRELARRNDTIT